MDQLGGSRRFRPDPRRTEEAGDGSPEKVLESAVSENDITYGGHAFGFREQYPKADEEKAAEFQRFCESRDEILPWIKEYSPLEHASADDPPLWLSYSQDTPAVKREEQQDPTHSAVFGLMLEERLKPLGVEIIVTYPAKPTGPYQTATDYFVDRLKAEEPQ